MWRLSCNVPAHRKYIFKTSEMSVCWTRNEKAPSRVTSMRTPRSDKKRVTLSRSCADLSPKRRRNKCPLCQHPIFGRQNKKMSCWMHDTLLQQKKRLVKKKTLMPTLSRYILCCVYLRQTKEEPTHPPSSPRTPMDLGNLGRHFTSGYHTAHNTTIRCSVALLHQTQPIAMIVVTKISTFSCPPRKKPTTGCSWTLTGSSDSVGRTCLLILHANRRRQS